MAHGWAVERHFLQAEAIRAWSPWKQASGPKSAAGKTRSSQNAFKGGRRARLRTDLAQVRAWMREIEDEALR